MTNIHCQTFFREKETVVVLAVQLELFLCLSLLLYACLCVRECCGHDHGGHVGQGVSAGLRAVCFPHHVCLNVSRKPLVLRMCF